MSDAIRLLLIDDHAIVRSGLRSMIEQQPGMRVAADAASGEEGVALYEQHRPDIVLTDLKMPGMDGVECTAAIRARDPQARVIVLTTFDGDESVFRALRAGARAYLLKETSAEEFFAVVRAVHSGDYHLPPALAARLAQRQTEAALSEREIEVLSLAARGNSNKEIGAALRISESTLKNHVNSILAKLHARDRTEAVTIALRRGHLTLD